MPERIVIETHPNEYIRTFHASALISEVWIFTFDSVDKERLASEDPRLLELYNSLCKIDGVTGVGLSKYEIRIEIGKAFDWPPIEEEVLHQIMDFHEWLEEEVDVRRKEVDVRREEVLPQTMDFPEWLGEEVDV